MDVEILSEYINLALFYTGELKCFRSFGVFISLEIYLKMLSLMWSSHARRHVLSPHAAIHVAAMCKH